MNVGKTTSAIIHNRFEVIFARSKITKTSKEPAIPSVFEFSDRTNLTPIYVPICGSYFIHVPN